MKLVKSCAFTKLYGAPLWCQGQAESLVEELFPHGLPPSEEPNSTLDTLVARLSQEMIDDFPASDPRWAESVPHGERPHRFTFTMFVGSK